MGPKHMYAEEVSDGSDDENNEIPPVVYAEDSATPATAQIFATVAVPSILKKKRKEGEGEEEEEEEEEPRTERSGEDYLFIYFIFCFFCFLAEREKRKRGKKRKKRKKGKVLVKQKTFFS